MHDSDNQQLKIKVKKLLAEYLGLETEDIQNEDSLNSDLHMQPADLSDFVNSLEENGIDTSRLDLIEIDSVEDLFEALA